MLTKMDMAKVIVTALYNLPKLVTEENKYPWKQAVKLSRMRKETLKDQYDMAMKVIQEKLTSANPI